MLVPVVIVLIGAWLYRWVDEDAFINFRIIDNLLAGHGLVFNLGERVEVDSDPLWLFTLTGLHEVLPFMALEWLSVLFGLVLHRAGFLTGGRAVQRLAGSRSDRTVFPLGLLMVSVVAGRWEFATSGLEMSMVFLWLGVVPPAGAGGGAPEPGGAGGGGHRPRAADPPELALGSVVFMVALLFGGGRPRLVAGCRSDPRYGLPVPPRWPCRSPTRSSAWATTPCWCPTPGWPRPAGRLVVPGLHLPVELRGSVHPVVALAAGGPVRGPAGPRLVATG